MGRRMVGEGTAVGGWVGRMMGPWIFDWVFVDRVMVGEELGFGGLVCHTRGP